MKKYSFYEDSPLLVQEALAGYEYSKASSLVLNSVFTPVEWSRFLYISERTLHRYKVDNKTFDPLHTDRIILLNQLVEFGIEVLGQDGLKLWLDIPSLPLGKKAPKDLLGTSFGIEMVKNELGRIQYGVYA